MFKKKSCKNCGNKISDKYEFCPYCGKPFTKGEDFGMLGKNDFIPSNKGIKFPMGMNMIFNSLMKNLNKQFSELNNEIRAESKPQKRPADKKRISISISSFGNNPPEIKVNSFGNNLKLKQQIKKIPLQNLSQENLKKISTLPKQEPLTNIRRLANKVIYEIEMPEVSSIKDILIVKLENSIEIKAIAKEKVYVKQIPINLPITNYELSQGKLILELGVKV